MSDFTGDDRPDAGAAFLAALEAAGASVVVHEHAPALSVEERQALPFPWALAVKTIAFLAAEDGIALVALRAEDRIEMPRLAESLGVRRAQIKPAPEATLRELGYLPGGVAPFSPFDGVRCVVDAEVVQLEQPVFCGGGAADRTFEVDPTAIVGLPRCELAHVARR